MDKVAHKYNTFYNSKNFTQLLQNCTILYNTLHNFYTYLQNSTNHLRNFTILQILQNVTKHYNALNNAAKLLKTIQNSTKLYNTIQHSTQLDKIIQKKLYNTFFLQYFTKLYTTQLKFTNLYTTIEHMTKTLQNI